MDITQLRYFLVTAETLNYTKAAERLFMSRQALRQALALMEEELGMPLFSNEKNKLSLTVQGEYLQLSARSVIASFDKMMEDVQQFAEGRTSLKVALSVSLFPFMLPEIEGILKRFGQKYPQIQLVVEYMPNDDVIQAVTSGAVDCSAVVQLTCNRPGILVQSIASYPLVISVGEKYRAIHGTKITLEELASYPCIGMGSMEQTLVPLYEDCKRKGLIMDYTVIPSTIDAFYKISHGEACGLDALMDEEPVLGNVYACYLDGYTWEVGMMYREEAMERKEVQLFGNFVESEYQRAQMAKIL